MLTAEINCIFLITEYFHFKNRRQRGCCKLFSYIFHLFILYLTSSIHSNIFKFVIFSYGIILSKIEIIVSTCLFILRLIYEILTGDSIFNISGIWNKIDWPSHTTFCSCYRKLESALKTDKRCNNCWTIVYVKSVSNSFFLPTH